MNSRLKRWSVLLGMSFCLIGISISAKEKDDGRGMRIIGGTESAKDAWPFMTALVRKGSDAFNGQICGASLINQRYVLTASHCVEGAKAENFDVVIGIHDLTLEASQGKRVAVKNIFMHEDYNTPVSTNNDMAILELETPVTDITPIKPITKEIMAKIKTGDSLTVMGWGNRSTTGRDFPNILHQVDVGLYDRTKCAAAYSGLTEQMLCAGFEDGGKDSCQGDSGGPIIVQYENEWYQIGVVSFGDGCALAGKPGVYAKVSEFDNWIDKNTTGISIKNIVDLGFVEESYEGEYTYSLSNFTGSELQVGSVSLNDLNNISEQSVKEDTCTGKTLANNAECGLKINFKATQSGVASLKLSIETSHPLANEINSKVTLLALAKTSFDANQALDSSMAEWFTGGDAVWSVQSTQVSKGSSALESGAINDYQQSILLATLKESIGFSVDFKTSTEADYDFLDIYIDGTRVFSKSGSMSAFENKSFDFAEGDHRVAFVYVKDSEQSGGDDKIYLDNFNVKVNNQVPVAAVSSESATVKEGKSFTLDASSSSDPDGDTLTYLWTQSSGLTAEIKDSSSAVATITAPKVKEDSTLVFTVTVTDSKGGSSSKTVTVTVKNKKKSGGSMGWYLLMLLPIVFRKRF